MLHAANPYSWMSRLGEGQEFLAANPTYLEWVFPLGIGSRCANQAPCMTLQDTAIFTASIPLQAIVLEMLDMVLELDGLHRSRTRIIVKDESLLYHHMRPMSCHLPRISRMLQSLRLLGRGRESTALFEALDDALGDVPALKRTLASWQGATYEPLADDSVDGSTSGKRQQPRKPLRKQSQKQLRQKLDKQPYTADDFVAGNHTSLPWGIRSWHPSDPSIVNKVKSACEQAFSARMARMTVLAASCGNLDMLCSNS